MKTCRSIRVFGHVHGVGFRYNAQLRACDIGITGFVRNEPNGTVYIEAEGEPAVLDVFVEWCHQGSPFGKVERVIVEDGTPKHFREFTIR